MRFNVKSARLAQLPAFSFGSGASWGYGTMRPVMVGGVASETLFENTAFPGILLKKVTSFGEILASCNGVAYCGGPVGYGNHLLVGSVFQHALDNRFPHHTAPASSPYQRDAYEMTATKINEFALAAYDADLQAQIPRVASSDPWLLSASGTELDQSALTFTHVYGVISLADAGYGTDMCTIPFFDLENGYWLSNRLLLGTIAQVLRDNKALFAGHGDGQKYVDMAVADYIRAGAHKDVPLGCHVASVYSRPAVGQPHTLRFGVPRIHPVSSYVSYPTKDYPFVFAVCGVTRVSTENAMIESVARGHRLVVAAEAGDGSHFAVATLQGGAWPAVVGEAVARLKEIPEWLLSPGAAAQMPVYGPNDGPLVSLGSTSAFVGPLDWFSAILRGPLGSPGYVEFLEAVREILSDAESYAKSA